MGPEDLTVQLTDKDRELLLQTFLAEAAEHLRALEEGLVALEANPADAELLHGIFRMAHSLKGDASMVGFPRIAEVAHALEDLLERLREQELAVTAERISLLLEAVDALRALLGGAASGAEVFTPAHAAVRDALSAAAHAASTAHAAAETPAARSDAARSRMA